MNCLSVDLSKTLHYQFITKMEKSPSLIKPWSTAFWSISSCRASSLARSCKSSREMKYFCFSSLNQSANWAFRFVRLTPYFCFETEVKLFRTTVILAIIWLTWHVWPMSAEVLNPGCRQQIAAPWVQNFHLIENISVWHISKLRFFSEPLFKLLFGCVERFLRALTRVYIGELSNIQSSLNEC